MPNLAKLEAIDTKTLKVTLPDGMSVTVGKPVPPEILELVAVQLRLQQEQDGNEGWCVVQVNN